MSYALKVQPASAEGVGDESLGHVRYIDALRGYAILGVVAIHAYILSGFRFSNVLLHGIFANGARGVQLFYLVSALTLFLSQERRLHREVSPLRNFYIRRFFRIVPMFYFGVLLYWVLLRPPGAPLYQIVFLAFGFSPHTLNAVFPGCWSIAIEAMLYSLFPMLFWSVRGLVGASVLLAISLLIGPLLFEPYLQTFFPEVQGQLASDFRFHWFGNQLPVFALGVVIFFVTQDLKKRGASVWRGAGFLIAAFCVIGLGFLGAGDPYYGGNLRWLPLPDGVQPFLISTLGLGLFVVGASQLNDRYLCNEAAVKLGRVSYSFYVFNFIVLSFVVRIFPKPILGAAMFWIYFGLSVAICFGLSSLTLRFIENPCIALGRRIALFFEVR